MLRFSRTRIVLVSVAVALAVLLAIPNLIGGQAKALLPAWLAERTLSAGFDLKGGSQLILELEHDEAAKGRTGAAVKEAVDVINRRINLFAQHTASEGAIVRRQSKNRILVQVPGEDDVARLKGFLSQTAEISFHFAVFDPAELAEAMSGTLPEGTRILYSPDDPPQTYLVEDRVLLNGRDIEHADAESDGNNQHAAVRLTLTPEGSKKLQDLTEQNIGKTLAVVLDGDVISAPVIRGGITTGAAFLSGDFTLQQAQDVAAALNGGVMPARFDVVDERSVYPGLGRDAGEALALAGLIAVIGSFAFLVIAYGLFGVFASLSVCVHILMMTGILSALMMPLSVPGIAAIILTIALAVDSNVIIYERIRDESLRGNRTVKAIDKGFARAFATIFDANIVLLLIVGVLALLAEVGPVRGFAVVMVIGIVSTVFAAYSVNRLIISVWLRLNPPPKELPL
jgi:protein-export membrane protein SecD